MELVIFDGANTNPIGFGVLALKPTEAKFIIIILSVSWTTIIQFDYYSIAVSKFCKACIFNLVRRLILGHSHKHLFFSLS